MTRSHAWQEELARHRRHIEAGILPSQTEIQALVETWSVSVSPPEHEKESFLLVDDQGQAHAPTRHAPRWLCHMLALRHRAAHVQLHYHSPTQGPTFIFQVRSWQKADFPGHIDLSVGGHVVGDLSPSAAAELEMDEELGLTLDDLSEPILHYLGGYDCQNHVPEKGFYDREWRDVYCAEIPSLERIAFKDEEVVGLYVCPVSHADELLQQQIIPVAHGLRHSLPLCLKHLRA